MPDAEEDLVLAAAVLLAFDLADSATTSVAMQTQTTTPRIRRTLRSVAAVVSICESAETCGGAMLKDCLLLVCFTFLYKNPKPRGCLSLKAQLGKRQMKIRAACLCVHSLWLLKAFGLRKELRRLGPVLRLSATRE